MNRLKYVIILSISFFLLQSCNESNKEAFVRNEDFNMHWKFYPGQVDNATSADLDDSGWMDADLPHDWSIMDYSTQDSIHTGPFNKVLPGGNDVGYLRNGTAWYRKHFPTPEKTDGKQFLLHFDGVQTQSEIWVNGKKAGENMYGYSPFNLNITSLLKPEGESNLIAVKTSNPGESSRWFAGAGIFRPVRLSIVNEVSIEPWGLYITTPEIGKESSSVSISVSIHNYSDQDAEVSVKIKIIDPLMNEFYPDEISGSIPAGESTEFHVSATVSDPQLWDTENPDLYTAIVNVIHNNVRVDTYTGKFGIRSIEYSAEQGFLLNGKEILLKGGCMHHDNGLLGSAAFPDAEFRRVRIMKENGYNAIRTSHNPPSEYFLNACDRYGILVIDEAFDHWIKPKRKNDYSNYFEEWHKKDIQAMVYRDRNHPSVIMWSIGNEIQERADPEGIEIGKKLKAAVHELDKTRPVTQAVCFFWDNPGKTWDYSAGAFEFLDISGYNYMYKEYERDHGLYPERIMYGSESFPLDAWDNWEMVKKHKYVIGDFVWTALDYIGESGIGHTVLLDKGEKFKFQFLQPWPWYISWCGDIDICGDKKAPSLYRDVVWGNSKLEMLVHAPIKENLTEHVSMWGWPEELPNWTWDVKDGQMMSVRVFSSYPEVRLELNGELIGSKSIPYENKYIAEFKVPYHKGLIKVTGIVDGVDKESKTLQSLVEGVSQLGLLAENDEFPAGRKHLFYIRVENKDNNGTFNFSEEKLTVKVSGEAELMSAGNASPEMEGSFTDKEFTLFRGKGLIILRSSGTPGRINIDVESESGKKATLDLESL